jgi:hypothetical protein
MRVSGTRVLQSSALPVVAGPAGKLQIRWIVRSTSRSRVDVIEGGSFWVQVVRAARHWLEAQLARPTRSLVNVMAGSPADSEPGLATQWPATFSASRGSGSSSTDPHEGIAVRALNTLVAMRVVKCATSLRTVGAGAGRHELRLATGARAPLLSRSDGKVG